MAKLCSSYSLCPLIEQKNFLGISDDALVGCVIVTLAKNIIIRYKLSDQKQLSSWSSKAKLSAPVVYDSIGKQYVGVFNGDQVAYWQDNFVQLNRVKKYKFVLLIHSVLSLPGVEPVVVFKNGCVATLSKELKCRKEPQCDFYLPTDQDVEDAKMLKIGGVLYVYLFVKSMQKNYYLHFIPVDPDKGSISKMEMVRDDNTVLMAYAITDLGDSQLITLWSDGKVFSLDLPMAGDGSFPGRLVSTLNEINPSLPAAMVPISSVHVAIYGADTNSEGAVLALFNTRFGVVQCSNHMKLYSNRPRLWRSGLSQLVLVIGQYLAVAPYQLATPRLATLVGMHGARSGPCQVPPILWTKYPTKSKKTKDKGEPFLAMLNEMSEQGLTETSICEELFPSLLEKEDSAGLSTVLARLTDIPETWVVKTIELCLTRLPQDRPLLRQALDVALVNDASTLTLVRASLPLASTLVLLGEICAAMHELEANPRVVGWAALLLDSHYQQYLLSKDARVVSTLVSMRNIVNHYMEYMQTLQSLKAHIAMLKKGKGFLKKPPVVNRSYFIEKLQLY